MSLEAIRKIINKHSDKDRLYLVEYYTQLAVESFENGRSFDAKKMLLLLELSTFLPSLEMDRLETRAIQIKVTQMRSFILENLKDNYSLEKTHFGFLSKWMKCIIKEIQETFAQVMQCNSNTEIKESRDRLLRNFHAKLSTEFLSIFCSYEKFNSGGNQLLIDLFAYTETFKEHTERDELLGKVEKRFMPNKCLSRQRIEEIYKKITENKQ